MSYNYNSTYNTNYTQRSIDSNLKDQLLEDIPEYGSAFVCGKSRFEEGKFHVRDDPIIEISCGDEHTGVVTERGRVFMFGSNNWGQLGLGHENNVEKPSCVKAVKHEKVKLISCGRNHTLLTTERGNIYSYGGNSEGQLGLGENATETFYNTPQKIEKLDQLDWEMISCGASHSCALSKSGDLYVWGSNENGELGLGKSNEQFYPKKVPLDFKVSFVSCGYYHTAIISKKGKLYTCGSNEYFQLGHNDENRRFSEVVSLEEPITFVSCGGHHTVAIGISGRVYSFGDGSKGQLGNGEDVQKSKRPELISFFRKIKIVQVSCGECHTAFISENGELYTCGDNRYGKLGLSQRTFNTIQFSPILVDKYKQLQVENVACGGCHMILIGKLKDKENGDNSDDSFKEKGYSERRFTKDSNGRSYPSPRNSSRLSSTIKSYDRDRGYDSRKAKDSESDENMEQTFNRTHTLTRDKKFVPLSELNLKKLVNEEKMKSKNYRNENNSDNDSDEKYNNSRSNYLKPNSTLRPLNRNTNHDDGYDTYTKSTTNRNRTNSNSDEDYFKNQKNFLKPIDKKYAYEKDNLKVVPYVKQTTTLKNLNSDDSDLNDTFKSKTSNSNFPRTNPNVRTFSKFNAKSFSDDESPKSYFSNDKSKVNQKPNSIYLRELKNTRNDSFSSQDKLPNRGIGQRRNLEHSNTNLRDTAKTNSSSNQTQNKKETEKPKEKPFKICTLL